MELKIEITNKGTKYCPVAVGNVVWITQRMGAPGKLTFSVIKDDKLDFEEGNSVTFFAYGKAVFAGFIFEKTRDKGGKIDVTAYDQLRYFKNKDTYKIEGKTATQFLHQVAKDFNLQTGAVAETEYVIPSLLEDDKTIFDMVQDTIDETFANTGNLFVLYDDVGKLSLKNINTMKLDILVDKERAENFDYTTSIDGETYNQIRVFYQDGRKKISRVHVQKSDDGIAKWGVLQYTQKVDETVAIENRAKQLLELYNKKSRTLTLNNCLGDPRVRAGCSITVALDLGDIQVNRVFACESVSHNFSTGKHLMQIALRGSDFIE